MSNETIRNVYFDNSATTRPYDFVIDLMVKIMAEDFGNPSSLHRAGIAAEGYVKTARAQVAAAMGASPEEIFFTSGGSESDNTAIFGAAYKGRRRGKKILTSAVEHPAVLESFARLAEEGYETVLLPVDGRGILDMEAFDRAMDDDVILISVMHVNNETGAIQPIEEIAKKKRQALFHVDMVQSFGKLPIDLSGALSGVDMASVSGHKIHGPKGVGALYIRRGLTIRPFLVGGGQEKGMRSGTENVPAIAGLGLAAEIIYKSREKKNAHLRALTGAMRTWFEENVNDILFNSQEDGAPHILSVSFGKTRGEVLLHTLEQSGIYVSTGSACSSNKKGMSHVIKAMGRTDRQVEGTLRFSLCDSCTMDDAMYVCEKTKEAVDRFRRLGSFR
ncbi:MAG: cysteine desulfurase [Clostridiales bacterium]|nr:cysteine desulfurase [Clostridiales bacterium]